MTSVFKRKVAGLLVNSTTGKAIGLIYRDRIPARGLMVRTASPLIRPEVKALLALGMYESAERRLVTRFLRSDVAVVELGSSIGYITGHIALRCPPHQVGVEANILLHPLIEDLMRLNGLTSVRLIHGAIDYSGRKTVRFSVNSYNTGSAVATDNTTRRPAMEVEVAALTLGDVVDREGIHEFALVCDIEGAERGMIWNENSTVIRRCRQMIIELHGGEYNHEQMSPDALAQKVQSRWGMQVTARDGNTWVFQRQEAAR